MRWIGQLFLGQEFVGVVSLCGWLRPEGQLSGSRVDFLVICFRRYARHPSPNGCVKPRMVMVMIRRAHYVELCLTFSVPGVSRRPCEPPFLYIFLFFRMWGIYVDAGINFGALRGFSREGGRSRFGIVPRAAGIFMSRRLPYVPW
ncbi:unnamed protein product [Ectocarpus sp. 6 AP-2014]